MTPLQNLARLYGGPAMSTTLVSRETEPVVLHFGEIAKQMDDPAFFAFCQANRDWRIELTHTGDLIVMAPTGGMTGRRNATLNARIWVWAEADGTGIGFDSSTGFTLPNGAKRSPDAAWIKRTRWVALTQEEREAFPPLCPDFVVELRSPSDSLAMLQAKMEEYLQNGAQLGWLIDPIEKRVFVYRPGVPPDLLKNPTTISGDPTLPGFTLDVQQLWNP
jgi:Uma2 family endonuclease